MALGMCAGWVPDDVEMTRYLCDRQFHASLTVVKPAPTSLMAAYDPQHDYDSWQCPDKQTFAPVNALVFADRVGLKML